MGDIKVTTNWQSCKILWQFNYWINNELKMCNCRVECKVLPLLNTCLWTKDKYKTIACFNKITNYIGFMGGHFNTRRYEHVNYIMKKSLLEQELQNKFISKNMQHVEKHKWQRWNSKMRAAQI